MNKSTAIKLLGGTPLLAAQACGYKAVQTIYSWPEKLLYVQEARVKLALERKKKMRLAKKKRLAKSRSESLSSRAG